jgi:hypothetical protein
MAGFKGFYLVLAKRAHITSFLHNSFNDLSHNYNRQGIAQRLLALNPLNYSILFSQR